MSMQRSIFTRPPVSQWSRLLFCRVSAMAVTRWRLPCTSSTVKQTPLCEMLWSILNSWEREDDIQNVLLVPVDFTASMVPMVSMIPVNMGAKFGNLECILNVLEFSTIFAGLKSLKGGILYYADY